MLEFQDTESSQPIHEVVMPLIATRDRTDAFVSGTAFVIAPGLAVTAYHVLEDFFARYEGVKSRTAPANTSFEILSYLTLQGGQTTLPLKLMRMWRLSPLDIAVVALGLPGDWPKDHVWQVPALDLLPPQVGTPVVGFGFANGRIQRDGMTGPLTMTLEPRTSTGKVVEVHHQLRDSVRLPFPCFRTSARFDGGMSGGPVFNNATGRICGVICSSLPATSEEQEHASYVSTLWPLVATMIDQPVGTPDKVEPYPLMRLFANGVLRADHLSSVDIVAQADGQATPIAKYDGRAWECPSA